MYSPTYNIAYFVQGASKKKHTRILLTVAFRAYCVNVLGVWWPMTVRATNQPFSYIFCSAGAHLKFIAIKQFTYLIIITHWIHSSQTSISTQNSLFYIHKFVVFVVIFFLSQFTILFFYTIQKKLSTNGHCLAITFVFEREKRHIHKIYIHNTHISLNSSRSEHCCCRSRCRYDLPFSVYSNQFFYNAGTVAKCVLFH